MSKMTNFSISIFLFLSSLLLVQTSNILFIPGHSSVSHTKGMYPMAESLASNGHHVVVLQFVKYEDSRAKSGDKSKVIDRYLRIPIADGSQPFRLSKEMIWGKMPMGGLGFVFPWKMTTDVCKEVLDHEMLRKEFYGLIEERRWDLVFIDDIFTACGMVAAGEARRLYNASIIDFGTSILVPQSQEIRALPINKALYPSATLSHAYFNHWQFSERLNNAVDYFIFYFVGTLIDYLVPIWLEMPRSWSTVPRHFALESDLLMASFSPYLGFTKPMARDVLELDAKCPSKAELPDDYRRFVEDERSRGTILFAMGHMTNWDEVPDGVLESFVEAFSRLPEYRIVWQYVSERANPRVPEHILLAKWIPQSGLLYHERTKLFISHVGGKSLRETICAGVPVVTMPMFAEQMWNAAVASKRNISTFLDKTQLSTSTIFEAITEILNNTRYQENTRKIQTQLQDQIMRSMDLGRFWAEFLTRHERSKVRKYFVMRGSHLSFLSKGYYDLSLIGMLGIFGLVKAVL